jgi:hypothetical protein
MKKAVTIFYLFCIVSIGAYGQGISGGVKGGFNAANQTYKGNNYTTSPNFKIGVHIGGYVTVMLSEHLGVQPEVLFSTQGYKSGNTTAKFNYIVIPILARCNINKLISFHAGPQFGVLASAKSDYGSGTSNIKNSYKGSDLGIAVGGTVDLPMGLNFTLRFIKGLSDIDDTASSTKVRNFNIQLSAGYRLFGKK